MVVLLIFRESDEGNELHEGPLLHLPKLQKLTVPRLFKRKRENKICQFHPAHGLGQLKVRG